jgi:hypothetical protein
MFEVKFHGVDRLILALCGNPFLPNQMQQPALDFFLAQLNRISIRAMSEEPPE